MYCVLNYSHPWMRMRSLSFTDSDDGKHIVGEGMELNLNTI